MTVEAPHSDALTLVEELQNRVTGEVRFDQMTRALYSTDASIYQIEPIGVVLPKSVDDVIGVLELANRHNVPVLPRGGGTSLAGQTVNHAIVIDFSKYMHDLIEVNLEESWARAQPGIILDELNRQLAPHGMIFAPDPSTSNRGNVGGALGNNSCGSHSIMWGKTSDNVIEMDAVLSNGEIARFERLDGAQLETKMRAEGLEGDIYRQLFAIGEREREEILRRYPTIQRRVSGYNLDEFVGGSNFDMARFVVGSEGTLATITEAKLTIVPRPKVKALSILHFHTLMQAMEATVRTLEFDPAAVELIDSMILRQARSNLAYSRIMGFVDGDPESLLVVEMVGDSSGEVESKQNHLEERMRRDGLTYAINRLTKATDQNNVWAVRKAGLGLMMSVTGKAKPLPFVEDTAVSPEVLPLFVKRFDEIVKNHGTSAGYYGHASVGCLHIRPLINLTNQDGVDKMVSIATEISDLVLEFGGSMSGEHGDGIVRGVWNEKMFGSRLYAAFRDVKQAFDPKMLMNPGKIIDTPPMTENLKIGPAYSTREISTNFAFAKAGSFAEAIEMCNGQGACRKIGTGTMCPSYMVTRDEEHSTRGRANALRAAISGHLPDDALTSQRLYDVLDLCLECKACKAECPSNVDMTALKYEFLNKYHASNGQKLRNRIFANISNLSMWGSFLAPISNWIMSAAWFKELLDTLVGIDRRRTLPPFAEQTFIQWCRTRRASKPASPTIGQVILLPDTFTNYNHPTIGQAAITVLERCGYEVIVPLTKCCGRPMLSKGLIEKARDNALSNLDIIYPHVKRGAKLVGIEPSCILSFRDDYVDLLEGDHRAKVVAEATMLIEELLLEAQQNGAHLPFKEMSGQLLFHGHCHQKALVGSAPSLEILRSIPNLNVQETTSGCCGMAGSFGFEKEHYDVSMKIGEQSLFPTIRTQPEDAIIVAEGISCRQQIWDGTGRKAQHLVEFLSDALSQTET